MVVVTGELGASAAGLRDVLAGKLRTRNAKIHMMPEAQVLEGEWLGAQSAVHAMCDISDGVGSDLQHILDESKKSAVLSSLPIAKGADWSDAFGGGEDYRLLLTVDRRKVDELSQHFESEFGKPLYKIGRIVKPSSSIYQIGLQDENGGIVYSPAGWRGYSHF